jgi:hypothetical protein
VLRLFENRVLRLFENRVLRLFENRLLRLFENRVLRLFENRVLRLFENRLLRLFENGVLRLFENRVLRRIVGPERDDMTGEWRTLHNEELNDLYSPVIFRVIKSRRPRWAGHVTRMEERRVVYRVLVGNLKGRDR